MISTRARTLTELVKENRRLDQAVAESGAFQDTTQAVVGLKDEVERVSQTYGRVADRLGSRIRADMRRTLEDVNEQAHEIRLQLQKNPRQANEIRKLTNRIAGLSKRVDDAWREWSLGQLRPHQEALRLVESLPEVQAQRTIIDASIERITNLSASSPFSDYSLIAYDEALGVVAASLSNLEGLSGTIRNFLDMVVSGKATLRELNPEIVAWISEGDRASAFQIAFKPTSDRCFR